MTSAGGGGSIPPIEIGSFVAPQPDKSEFIGSASGVFFVHTVFRAFAAVSSDVSASPTGAQRPPQGGVSEVVADPGSAHDFLVASENTHDEVGEPTRRATGATRRGTSTTGQTGRDYGITTPGLGRAPELQTANRLIMTYFRHWHPLFPFLHGPSFFEQISHFYEEPSRSSQTALTSTAYPTEHAKSCRAVIFQCVFNLAASCSGGNRDTLPSYCRIESNFALMSLMGVICITPAIVSLQALLAMELYLISHSALRAASTIHGALTRMLYHLGLHRCPYRYVQLPRDVCNLRQRIFWCAYVLDRYLSQALGHPTSINDEEIDACIPAMKELHQPVRPRGQTSSSEAEATAEEEVRAHLPKTPTTANSQRVPQRNSERADDRQPASTTPTLLSAQSPAHHHRSKPDEAGEYVLAYLVTYSRLVGRALDLFHVSIPNRDISWDKILSLTCEIRSWWNTLPSALQHDDGGSSAQNEASQYGTLFAILYSSLILFINRPFLSLPTHRTDFRSSLQDALTASRSVISVIRQVGQDQPLVWPGTLSALWMSGLVVSFASLLEHYPFEKAKTDLEDCFKLLNRLSPGSASARRCEAALRALLAKLSSRYREDAGVHHSPETPIGAAGNQATRSSRRRIGPSSNISNQNKRRRLHDQGTMISPTPVQTTTFNPFQNTATAMPSSNFWQPVLEYMGPDFGFDSGVVDTGGPGEQDSVPDVLNLGSNGLFSGDMWEAYLQGAGDNLNF